MIADPADFLVYRDAVQQTKAGTRKWRSYRGRHFVSDHPAGLLTVVWHDDMPNTAPTFMIDVRAIDQGALASVLLSTIEAAA